MDIKDIYKRVRAIDENQSIEECGIMPMPGVAGQQDNVSMNLSMNANGAGGIRDLMGILRNIEHGENTAQDAGGTDELNALFGKAETHDADVLLGAEPEMDEAYGNSMQDASGEIEYDAATVTNMGSNDGRGGYKARKVNGGENPMHESLVDRLSELYQEIKEGDKKTMSRAAKGNEKYGKDGMKALAKAGRDGASEKKLDAIRDKHDKYDESTGSFGAYGATQQARPTPSQWAEIKRRAALGDKRAQELIWRGEHRDDKDTFEKGTGDQTGNYAARKKMTLSPSAAGAGQGDPSFMDPRNVAAGGAGR